MDDEPVRDCSHDGCQWMAREDGLCYQHEFLASDRYHPERSKKYCSYGKCPRLTKSRRLCEYHYKLFIAGQKLTPSPNSSEYFRWLEEQPVVLCKFEGCGRKHKARGYCSYHYPQYRSGRELTRHPED